MKLGTKIMLLTLALTMGLSGAVIWLVTSRVTERERALAREAVARVVGASLARLDDEIQRVDRITRLMLEEPQSRALLERLFATRAKKGRDEFGEAQLREEILGRNLQSEVRIGNAPPAFHLLTDDRGNPLIAAAPGNPGLQKILESPSRVWPVEGVVAGKGRRGRYLWTGGKLYAAICVPLRLDVGDAPTHVYLVGSEVSPEWLDHLLGGMGVDATGAEASSAERAARALHVWFLVDGKLVARDSGAGGPAMGDAAGERALAHAAASVGHDYQRGEISFKSHGERWVGVALPFEPAPGMGGAYILASSLDAALASLRSLQRSIAVFAGAVTLIAIVACVRLARAIARPVERLERGADAIARGEFGVKIEAKGRDELASLARSFNHMAAGLEQRDLIKDTFGKFVDPKVVEGILADPSKLKPGGELRVQSVLFSDLAGFTHLSERLGPEELVRVLNDYLGAAADEVASLNGIVDKFIGDAVVAFWGPPLTDDHAARACRAALRFVAIAEEMRGVCESLGCPPLRARVGVATGEMLVGNIGSRSKFNYTVMGDMVNLGSRLEGLNKAYDTGALTTAETAREVAGVVVTRRIDVVRVVGRDAPVALYEILRDAATPAAPGDEAWRGSHGRGMARYEAGEWAAAADAFDEALHERPCDGPSKVLAERCRRFRADGPPAGWDGVWTHESK